MELPPGIVNTCPNVLQGASAQLFTTLINTLLAAQCSLGPEGRYPPDYGPKLKDGDEFDFIVVGAGSAGSVVAARLSEVPEWKVLLLEAGGYPSAMSEIPAFWPHLINGDQNWKHKTQESGTCCSGFKNKEIAWPRGRGLGGCSSINAMQYTRSTIDDHKAWENAGNPGWDHSSVSRFYNKLENAHIENDPQYGTTGPLHLSRYTSTHPIRKILQGAYEEMGYGEFTEDKPVGFRDNLVSVHQGTRQSSAKAFLAPAKDRENLYVAVDAEVGKLLIDDGKVKGVDVMVGQKVISLKIRKEVVVSAGTINSPVLLMNSGIGPEQHLSTFGIDIVKDLNVGNNLRDHVAYPALAVGFDQSAVNSETPQDMIDQIYQFFMHRQGGLAQVSIVNFYSNMNAKKGARFANMQLIPLLLQQNDQHLKDITGYFELREDFVNTLASYNKDSPIILFIVVFFHTKSTGSVRLSSADVFAKPTIIPNLLSREEDIEGLLEAIQVVPQIIKTKAFAPYQPKFLDMNITNCKGMAAQSDEWWRCAVRNIATSFYHLVGTCKMGPQSDPTAVVDPRLRVHGVTGVRVADCSIMPTVPSCNTNAPAMMIGEKGAEMIKEDWLPHHNEL